MTLRYGAEATLRLELAEDALIAHCDAPRGQPLRPLADGVDRALAEPFGFPALVQATVPNDKVALALAPGVPQAPTIVARIVNVLVTAGVAPADITLLETQADRGSHAPDPEGEVGPIEQTEIVRQVHDPRNRDGLSYLAASAGGAPIYINRAIHDADLVISIGCLRSDESPGYHGIHSNIFPTFSDEASAERYRAAKSNEPAERERLRNAASEVGWLLGAPFTVQVVPGAGKDVLHVLAGEPAAVHRQGCDLVQAAWNYAVPGRASLVVTTIEGDATQQTWDSFARALAAASQAVTVDGSVAVCCELSERPGPALQHVIGADDLDAALREIGKDHPADVLAATELARALDRGNVYLLSRLDNDLVEDLGMLPVTADQFSRLAARYDSCVVLSNAHHALARPRGDAIEQRPRAKRRART